VPIDLRDTLRVALSAQSLHFYLDASVLVDIVRPDIRPESRELLEMALAKGWRCTSSPFARMEALDTVQTKEWLRQGIEEGRDPKALIRGMWDRRLAPDRLAVAVVRKAFYKGLAQVQDFVKWRRLDRRGWEEAITLAMTTNIWAPDCIHWATALREGCHVLVTTDDILAKAVRERTMASMASMASDKPEQVLPALRSLAQ
jgi:predicted nucleic acid-binding protein